MTSTKNNLPLGKAVQYESQYNPALLFPISRVSKREEIGVDNSALPFTGVDIWNAYEVSFLDVLGKPCVAIAQFYVPCDSPYLIESKSLKLYLNSFNQSQFASFQAVTKTLINDLSEAAGGLVEVKLMPLSQVGNNFLTLSGECLDDQQITCNEYLVNPNLLGVDPSERVKNESLYTNLLKSNCLVTGQPDWGTLWINYSGPRILKDSLLRYVVSFRNHDEFHEQCIERVFMDISAQCQPEQLTVQGFYTRRGGLDINPFRTNNKEAVPGNQRLIRQ